MRLVNNRLLVRALVHTFLAFLFFWLGVTYHKSQNASVLSKMSPEHLSNHPELIEAWESGLKYKDTFLLVVILTSPKNQERRKVIRDTWANVQRNLRESFLLYFVIGNAELSDDTNDAINEERAQHKDILALPFVDSYQALTSKLIAAFTHLNRNVKFKYLLKVDDDSYVQLPSIIEELKNSNFENSLYWGFFDGRAPVFRTGKWAQKDYYLCDRYLPYALGGGYVLSQDLVQYIADNAKVLQKFNSEDVSVGTWLGPLKVHRIHDERFDTEYQSRGCDNKFLVSHKQSVEDFRSKHYSLQAKGVLCEKEVQSRPSYQYNWNELPSKCCIRNQSDSP